jgi:hypothetical protein
MPIDGPICSQGGWSPGTLPGAKAIHRPSAMKATPRIRVSRIPQGSARGERSLTDATPIGNN